MASDIKAGEAYVKLSTRSQALERGLRAAQAKLRRFSASVSQLGRQIAAGSAAVLAPLAASAKIFSSYGDSVAKMSKRTGVSVQTLSELQFVAAQTGTNFETLENAFRKMQRSIYDAGRGLSTQTEALADLSLTYEDLKDLTPEQQFKKLADAISQIEDPTRQAGIAMALLGRTGTNLLPMFAQGAAGIEALQREARRLGLTMSSEDAKAAEDFTDAMDALFKVTRQVAFQIGAALAPALSSIAQAATAAGSRLIAFAKDNRELILTVAKFAALGAAVGVTLIAIGGAAAIAAATLGALASAVKAGAAVMALLTSSTTLTIAGVIALGVGIVAATGQAGPALKWLSDRFAGLSDTASKAWGAIGNALASGDISAAARILWLSVKKEFLAGTQGLREMIADLRYKFAQAFLQIGFGIEAALTNAFYAIRTVAVETFAFIGKALIRSASGWANAWSTSVGFVADGLLELQGLYDKDLDVDLAKQERRNDTDRQKAAIDTYLQGKSDDIEQGRASALTDAASRRDSELTRIGTEYEQAVEALTQSSLKELGVIDEQIGKARAEWQAAIDRQNANAAAGSDTAPAPGFDADAIRQRIEELLDEGFALGPGGTDRQGAELTSSGTFNPFAVQGLGASTFNRIATATEQTADNTRELIRTAQRQSGRVFR